MKLLSFRYFLLAFTCSVIVLPACKTKKVIEKPAPAKYNLPDPAPATKTQNEPPAAQEAPAPEPAPAKPDYNFSNIQFEFNSAVLKTESYQVMDKMAAEMRKDNTVKFVLNGHSSTEGTTEHNMQLSVERANSVKTYLVNSGVDASRLTVKGYGETKPIADNNTEEGKSLNRRVDVKVNR